MNKMIRRFLLISISLLMTGTPAMSDDVRCNQLMESYWRALDASSMAETKKMMKIIIPKDVCNEEISEKKNLECIVKWRDIYAANTFKPMGYMPTFDLNDRYPLYTKEAVYWNKVIENIILERHKNKCPYKSFQIQ